MNPPKLTKMPHPPKKEMGIEKTMEVTTMAKIRRIQFNAA
jgi:hypothetical protein